MFKIFSFPSVFSVSSNKLVNIADDLISGLKITHEELDYIVGELAINEGASPHKGINNSPEDEDYQILMKSSLLLAGLHLQDSLHVTTGFPFATYPIYQGMATQLLAKNHNIKFHPTTYDPNQMESTVVNVSVKQAYVVPELEGSVIAIRKGDRQDSGNFFVVSLGYGTFEAGLSTESGIVQRTIVSRPGVRYAVNYMTNQLRENHFLGMRTEHQMDLAFQKGRMVIGRKKTDLVEQRNKALEVYYDEIISPNLASAFSDSDFERADKVYLVGGGTVYKTLVNKFKEEFDDVLDVIQVEEGGTMASRGYCLNSLKYNEGDKSSAVGIDIGNAYTTVAIISDSVST